MTTLASAGDRPVETIGGVRYVFRTPTVYDVPKMTWRLTRARVRRPGVDEYRQSALAGVAAMAAIADAAADGAAQTEIVNDWYDLLTPIDEDEIDEPDMDRRAIILAERRAEQRDARAALLPSILAIEANLDRHWQDWAELRADAKMWDQVSQIDAARLLLLEIDGAPLPRVTEGDDQGLVTEAAFMAIPAVHRVRLGGAALGLLAPSESERKN